MVAIIAIWGNRIRSWWSGPRLRISLHNTMGELTKLTDGTPVRYYHLRVVNGRKGSPAQHVRVLLAKIFQSAADGTWADQSFSGPLQLTWQFPQAHPQYPLIGPDDISDLGCIIKGKQFSITPYIVPNNFNGYVGPNQRIKVEIIAVADNGQSKPVFIEIAWDGNWSDDPAEMGRHLVVKEVAR